MIGYPLDSHVEYDSNGTPIYDRAITSAPLRKLYKQLFSDGVMPNPSTNMQVSAGDGMNVIVQPGFAMCNGCLKLEEAQRTLAVQASSTAYDRIDTVVLRLNDNDSERICDLYVLEGTPATSPVRPTLTRTESIWELGLADLFIAKNSTIVSNQRITDTRYETERCGIVSSISQFDTDTLYQQIQADLAYFKEEEQAEFLSWFADIQGQLSGDVAGNLQTQIGSLPSLVTEVKDSLVSAINWIADKLSLLAGKIGESDISGIGDGTVTGAIVSQEETIEALNNDLTSLKEDIQASGEWESLASFQGVQEVALPDDTKEVCVVMANAQGNTLFEYCLPIIALSTQLQPFYKGYTLNTGTYGACACYFSKTSIKPAYVAINGTSQATTMITNVYVKR